MFSKKELKYLKDVDFLRTKRQLSEDLVALLGNTQSTLRALVEQSDFIFPKSCDLVAGKISKGENYHELPYWVLDYPKYFTRESSFSLRTMLWWGNEWSITLHLQGKALADFHAELWQNLRKVNSSSDLKLYLCVGENPWEYHFGSDNYQLLSACQNDERLWQKLTQKDFCKISRKLAIEQSAELPNFAQKTLQIYLNLLSKQL